MKWKRLGLGGQKCISLLKREKNQKDSNKEMDTWQRNYNYFGSREKEEDNLGGGISFTDSLSPQQGNN